MCTFDSETGGRGADAAGLGCAGAAAAGAPGKGAVGAVAGDDEAAAGGTIDAVGAAAVG
ncbi:MULTISPECIES: hypothetical protein [unclassified Salinibacterium]|uniref:hypothetical protein n=1 Tax=unclassified Salinibacterium TaxID=2632331 RepID=UPI00143D25FE|nr:MULTISPECIES: hypothetical protein [unclassified Salinibacterium]